MLKDKQQSPEIKRDVKGQQLPLPDKNRRRQNSKEELKGSRWAGIILLLITVVISILFYLQGRLRRTDTKMPRTGSSTNQELFGTKTYRFEK